MTRILDAHLHLWRLPRGPQDSPYAWIVPDRGGLHRDYTPQEAGAELAGAGVAGAVLVQADDTVADTLAMLEVCEQQPWAHGVVGWVPLDSPALAEGLLERWRTYSTFCGVRHLVHNDPRPDFLELGPVRASLRMLAETGVPYDVPDAFPRHLAQVLDLAHALPELSLVVDHLGKPPLAAGPGSAPFRQWESQLRAVAAAPRTVAKVSGLRIPGAPYDLATLRPALDVALDAFGPGRLMYGGDWPMTVPYGGYLPNLHVLAGWVQDLPSEDRDQIWHGSAERVYRIPPPDGTGVREGSRGAAPLPGVPR